MAQGERGRRLLRRGEALFRAGDALQYLYQLRAGSLKIRVTNHAGLEQITAFPASGALLGSTPSKAASMPATPSRWKIPCYAPCPMPSWSPTADWTRWPRASSTA